MSAIELGPAIFGMGKAVGEAARVVYGDETRISVEVRADFEHASFGIEFFAVANPAGLSGGLSLQDLAALASLLGFTAFGSAKGVLGILKWLRGRRIAATERAGDRVTIIAEDNATVSVTFNEYRVFADPAVRDGISALAQPLQREGVNQLEIQRDRDPPVTVDEDEAESFDAVAIPEEEVSIDRGSAILEVVSPVFRDDNSWNFAQGVNRFWARITEQEFLAQVAKHRTTFGRGDALRVEMETRTTRHAGGLKYHRTILRVLEHLTGPAGGEQLTLS